MDIAVAKSRASVAPAKKYLVCLGNHSLDNLGRLGNVVDQPDRLTGNHGRNVEITGGFGRRVFGGDRPHILQELEFAPGPATGMIVDQAASGKRCRPDVIA